jgi:hypothetical protein
MVCDGARVKGFISTLYFVGTYGVLLCGILSDKSVQFHTALIKKKSSKQFILLILFKDWEEKKRFTYFYSQT